MELEHSNHGNQNDHDDALLHLSITESSSEIDLKEQELALLRKLIDQCRDKRKAEEQRLYTLERLAAELSKSLESKAKQLSSVQRQLNSCCREVDAKEREHVAIRRRVEERELEIKLKEERLRKMERRIGECERLVRTKDDEISWQLSVVHRMVVEYGEVERKLLKGIHDCEKDLGAKESRLSMFEGLIREREQELKARDLEFDVDFGRKEEELKAVLLKIEECNKEIRVKEEELEAIKRLINGEGKQLQIKRMNVLASMKERSFELDKKETKLGEMVKDFELRKKEFERRVKEHESEKMLFVMRVQEFESREKQYDIQFEEQVKELEFQKNQYEAQVKELEMKEAEFGVKLKKLESNEKHLEQQVKDFKTKETQFERKQKELEFKSFEQEKGNSTNLELLFNVMKEYELVCSKVSDALRTSEEPTKLVLDTMKGFCPPQLGQHLVERDASILRRTCNLLLDELRKSTPVISFHVKEEATKLAREWKVGIELADKDCLEVLDFFKFIASYEIGSSFEGNELQSLLYIVAQHCQAPQIHGDIEKLPDNQSSSTSIDGGNSQLLSDEPKLMDKDIIARLQASPDPSKLVLDIIQKPIFPQNRKGNEGIIIDESHIFLFEQLMTFSPHIKPEVREEARKLAIDLKESMRGSTENSLVVLGFLLLVSIYGLVSYFDEDEILKLVEVIAQHKQAVELFRTLGFADKIEDFIQNLIMKNQHVEAVKFICAYKLADKFEPVKLLRQHIEYVKGFSRRGRKKCTERKVMDKDNEIACLVASLECISDNNLESQDLVHEIKERILFLQKHKKSTVHEALESSLKVETPQPEEKNLANEAVSPKDQVQQHEEKRPANEAVTKNQGHQLKAKQHANGSVAKNQPANKRLVNRTITKSQVCQPKAKNHAKWAVSKTEVKQSDQTKASDDGASSIERKQPESEKCATEGVTMNQVQQPQQKKRAVQTFSTNGRSSNQGCNNNKRPRTAERCSAPPVYTSYSDYRSGFIPTSRMTPQLGFPANYFGPRIVAAQYGNRKIDYYYHSGRRFPFRGT